MSLSNLSNVIAQVQENNLNNNARWFDWPGIEALLDATGMDDCEFTENELDALQIAIDSDGGSLEVGPLGFQLLQAA